MFVDMGDMGVEDDSASRIEGIIIGFMGLTESFIILVYCFIK